MQFTGTQLLVKRSFYTQSGNFGVGLNCTVNNTSGTYWFGVSGDQGAFEFMLQSGRISLSGQFLHSYQSNRAFALEAQFNTGTYNVVKDGAPMVFGAPKATGNYSYFYFKRASTDMSGTFNLYVTGESTPTYTLQNNLYLTQSGQNAVTGYFLNQSLYPVRIFDSTAVNPQNLSFGALAASINGGNSGAFAFSGDFTQFDFTQAVLTNFATNFGPTYANVYIYDVRAYNTFVTFAPIADYSFNPVNVLTRTLSYNNWSGQFQSNGFNAALNFRLDYVSGTGAISISPLVITTGVPVSGFFNQTGNYSGLYSIATVISGNSGAFTGLASQIGAFAEGAGTFLFSGARGTGMATGLGFTGQTSGSFTGSVTGFIASGQTGLLRVSGNLVGTGMAINIGIVATGYLDISNAQYGDVLVFGFNSGAKVSRQPVPVFNATGFYETTGLVFLIRNFFGGATLGGFGSGFASSTSGVWLASGVTGSTGSNALRIYSLSGNSGYITGTNGTTGFGFDAYQFTGGYRYSGSVTLMGGEVGFATGFIAFNGNIGITPTLIYNPFATGYGSQNAFSNIINGATFWAQALSGDPSGYGLNGVVTGGILYLTSLTSGALGNSITIYNPSGFFSPINSGTNYATGSKGVQQVTGYHVINYNSYIQLTGGNTITVSPIGPFTGAINFIATGSGQFSKTLFGSQTGGFSYTRTFTGNWDLLTGYNMAAMVSLKVPGGYNDHSISGTGNFVPNGNMVFQVTHNRNLLTPDVALLTISGAGVLSGISQLLYN